jgi:hypothetical protein
MMTGQRARWAAATMVGGMLLALTPAAVRAADEDIVKQVEAAKTPADHEAIAARYDALAKEARDNAAMHRTMAKQYQHGANLKGGLGTTNASMARHCETLAKNFDTQAKEFEAMAKAQRQLGAKAK